MSLIKKVQNTIFRHSLFKRGDKIVLAVSGGPDSVCLLDVFFKLQKKYNLELTVAHVNYGLRGTDSEKDEKFVRDLAYQYGLKIQAKKIKIKGKAAENYLRDIRYAFFETIRQKKNYDSIAVAHTLDDQAETYLMRVLRGAGLAGLSAMKYESGNIIRPFLNITRQEIINYLKENKLHWRIDKTNLEKTYLRNRIRNGLIPYLEKRYNPKIKSTLSDSATAIAEDYDFLKQTAENKFKKNSALKISKILKLHPAIQRRIILAAISNIKKNLKNIGFSHIEEILKIVRSKKSKLQIVLFQKLKVTRKGDKLGIKKI